MTEKRRLEKALDTAARYPGRSLFDALPPPSAGKRAHKVVIHMTEEELERVNDFADSRGEPRAVALRHLIAAALQTLGRV